MNITVSLETAKKLKEAGWEKRTILTYYIPALGLNQPMLDFDTRFPRLNPDNYYYAPILSEILEELPPIIIGKSKSGYRIEDGKHPRKFNSVFGGIITEMAALLWIKLQEKEETK